MRKAVSFDGIPEGGHDMILPENIFKSPGSVFAGEDLVAHRAGVRRKVGSGEWLPGVSGYTYPGGR